MPPLGRTLIFLGIFLAAVGAFISMGGKIPWIGRLPGDIAIKRDHFSFYVPITTCLVISLLLTLLSRFFGRK